VVERASKKRKRSDAPGGAEAATPGTIAFDDGALVERCRKGDMKAFGLLVAKYQDRVFNLLCRMCRCQADAEELAQETFLKALERIGQFRGGSGFYTWLFRIAANLAISHRRRAARIHFRSMTAPAAFDGAQADGVTASLAARRDAGPAKAALAAERLRRTAEAIEELPDEFRVVTVLRDIEEMHYAEIARVLDLPIGTVKSRLFRARCLLAEKLNDLID
jgi:RNA polymerase sigma-70 factor (ECF subfamily)